MKTLSVFDERRVPRDIRQYVTRRILVRVIPCVLLIAVFLSVLVMFDSAFFGAPDKPLRAQAQAMGYILAIAVPMLIMGVPFKLIDKSFEGEVVKVHAYTTVENPRSGLQMRDTRLMRLNIRLTIKTPEGKLIRRRAATAGYADKRILDVYRVGDTVLHLWGTDHTVVLPTKPTDPVNCVICGRKSRGGAVRCECGYSLMRR